MLYEDHLKPLVSSNEQAGHFLPASGAGGGGAGASLLCKGWTPGLSPFSLTLIYHVTKPLLNSSLSPSLAYSLAPRHLCDVCAETLQRRADLEKGGKRGCPWVPGL